MEAYKSWYLYMMFVYFNHLHYDTFRSCIKYVHFLPIVLIFSGVKPGFKIKCFDIMG